MKKSKDINKKVVYTKKIRKSVVDPRKSKNNWT